jgi:hypothetical protein
MDIALLDGVILGGESELRFFQAMQAWNWKPGWLISIRHANRDQDLYEATDAIAELDVGVVPIQIKSSVYGARKHRELHGDMHVIIIVRPEFSLKNIQRRTIAFLERRRKQLLRRKRKGR